MRWRIIENNFSILVYAAIYLQVLQHEVEDLKDEVKNLNYLLDAMKTLLREEQKKWDASSPFANSEVRGAIYSLVI